MTDKALHFAQANPQSVARFVGILVVVVVALGAVSCAAMHPRPSASPGRLHELGELSGIWNGSASVRIRPDISRALAYRYRSAGDLSRWKERDRNCRDTISSQWKLDISAIDVDDAQGKLVVALQYEGRES